MIRFDSITKQYPGTNRPALSDVSLEVLRGEFVFLVGASGSGKSSCLRLILKEEKPTKGAIHVLGQDLGRISSRKVPYFRRNLGVVFQDFRLLNNKSVYENVAFTLQVIGKSRGFIQEAVPDVLNMVGLAGKGSRLPHELSGGEQQRVAIARAVVNKPQILLADEPTGNLDPVTSAGIMAVLERINAGGTTVLMATHEAAIVDQMQRRVIELVDGRLVRDERHGGYGVTTAIPLPDLQEAEAAGSLPAYAALTEAVAGIPQAAQLTGAVPVHYESPAARPQPARESASLSMLPAPGAPASRPEAATQVAPPTEPEAPSPTPVAERPPIPPMPGGGDTLPAAAFAPESELTASTAHIAGDRPASAGGAPQERAAASDQPVADQPASGAALNDHFPSRPVHPLLPARTEDDELPEHLRLAERLGLRAPGEEEEEKQNVGPTK